MRLRVLIFVILSIGCAKKNDYLQEREIALVQPIVKATSTIIDSSVVLTANLRMKDVDLFYTDDGTIPNENSLKYSGPLSIKKEGVYSFKAFHADWKPSAISKLKLYKKGKIPETINWETSVSATYPGIGDLTVLNNKKGSLDFRDKQWFGYDSIAKATVYFKEKTLIDNITIGYLVDTKSWIFPPSEVKVYLNGEFFLTVDFKELYEDNIAKLDDVEIPINRKLNTITIEVKNTTQLPEWHPGKGFKAWLFMDEWIFN